MSIWGVFQDNPLLKAELTTRWSKPSIPSAGFSATFTSCADIHTKYRRGMEGSPRQCARTAAASENKVCYADGCNLSNPLLRSRA